MTLTVPLYMLRHGETAWNTERRMDGWRSTRAASAAAPHLGVAVVAVGGRAMVRRGQVLRWTRPVLRP